MTTTPSTTTSAARAADVLLLFVDEADSLGISEIARRLGLSKAVVHRIVTTFAERGILAPHPSGRGYHLGPASVAVGARALRSSSLRAAARTTLGDLQRATGETATLSALVGEWRTFIAQVESPSEIKMTVEIGRRFPLDVGSSGRCILAFQRPERIAHLLRTDPVDPDGRLDGRPVPDRSALWEQLREARERGWSMSADDAHHGAVSVAAPVLDVDGLAVGAISVCGPAERMDLATRTAHADVITAAADRVSRRLGWRGGLPDLSTQDGVGVSS